VEGNDFAPSNRVPKINRSLELLIKTHNSGRKP
jgi:hypothetical protein